MAGETGDQDKTEDATPFKLEEARKRGQVFKSPEINSLAILGGALFVGTAFGAWTVHGVLNLGRDLFGQLGRATVTPEYVLGIFRWLGERSLFLLAPLLVVTVIASVLANFFQTGPVFSFHPIKPDFTKLNPAQGLKRVFAVRSLYEGLKTLLKFGVLAAVTYAVILHLLPDILDLLQKPMSAYPASLLHIALLALMAMLLAFAVLAFADNAYARWEYRKKMMMSRRELTDEIRRREGDPQIRSRRRDLLNNMRKNVKSLGNVGNADLLITNPTHFAVALRYDRATMRAPKVVSKGAGDLALRMRQLAFRYGVTVVERPALARELFRNAPLDGFVPEGHYAEVAALLRPVFEARLARSSPT